MAVELKGRLYKKPRKESRVEICRDTPSQSAFLSKNAMIKKNKAAGKKYRSCILGKRKGMKKAKKQAS